MYGKFCHICGQENVEIKETFWHLVTHFVYDITHFDGKFFSTVKALLFKPGFLSYEYMLGRRTNYLNPIKMYVFTSAFFFIFFFSIIKPVDAFKFDVAGDYATVKSRIESKKKSLEELLKQDSLPAVQYALHTKNLALLNADLERIKFDTTHLERLNFFNIRQVQVGSGDYFTLGEYNQQQKALPLNKRDGWLKRQIETKKLQLFDKYGNDYSKIISALLDKFFHLFPQILFVSLPLFAMQMKLLYIRRRQYYYADHGIYAVHLYCAMFILIFMLVVLSNLEKLPYLGWTSIIGTIVSIYAFWYIYKSMKNFYSQSRSKTVLKFLLLLLMSTVVISFLFGLFFIFSAFTI
ncbi:MAG: hypothetical protein JWQ96_196 [Segetibacter sp.]|nr:hypothetical protein [Segetibacter sp.]